MRDVKERFESKVKKTETCWIWMAGISKDGYGRFRFGKSKARAHRVSYLIYKGNIPPGMLIMHSCDNPKCVNPEHLSIGTTKDNTDDMYNKGRGPDFCAAVKSRRSYKGENHPIAKLSETQAKIIIKDTRTHSVIAKDYGVTRATISHLKRGLTWLHLPR